MLISCQKADERQYTTSEWVIRQQIDAQASIFFVIH